MKTLLALLLLIPSLSWGKTYMTQCVSESGNSIYDLSLNTSSSDGTIRYRYMGQDIIYDVHIYSSDNDLVKGIATFKSSNSGETKGNPFDFQYFPSLNKFSELNIIARCT